MTEAWKEAVDRHRDTLETLADTDLPLSKDARELLEEYERD